MDESLEALNSQYERLKRAYTRSFGEHGRWKKVQAALVYDIAFTINKPYTKLEDVVPSMANKPIKNYCYPAYHYPNRRDI